MFLCHNCKCTDSHPGKVNHFFEIDDKPVFVEGIPAEICNRCGAEVFSRDTTERVRRIVHGEARPVRTVQMEVFSFT